MIDEAVANLLKREGTGISWADFTYNPWLGCTKVGPPCDFCYAEDLIGKDGSRLKLVGWGPGQPRKRTSYSTLTKPLRWNRVAGEHGLTLQVFCLSLGDWADNEAEDAWRLELAVMIRMTPHLQWMLLTKRISNAAKYLRAMFPEGVPPNVALGITVALQNEADRDVPRAIKVKRDLGVRRLFLSMEPLLGPVQLLVGWMLSIDLVIVGGESGKHARPMHPAWVDPIMELCLKTGVRFHFKQWGDWVRADILGDGSRLETTFSAGLPLPNGIETTVAWPDGAICPGRAEDHGGKGIALHRLGTKKAGRAIAGREYLERLAA